MKLLATFILLTLIVDALLLIAVDATEEAGIKHSEAVERYLSRVKRGKMKQGALGCAVGGVAGVIGGKMMGSKGHKMRNALAGCAVGGGGAIIANSMKGKKKHHKGQYY